jgi:hypothetical protein
LQPILILVPLSPSRPSSWSVSSRLRRAISSAHHVSCQILRMSSRR